MSGLKFRSDYKSSALTIKNKDKNKRKENLKSKEESVGMTISLVGWLCLIEVAEVLKSFFLAKNKRLGNSLALQWLGFCTPTAGTQVHSQVKELRSHKPRGAAKKASKTTKKQAKNPKSTHPPPKQKNTI